MNGYMMYELATQRIADQRRAAQRRQVAREAATAHKERAAARGRHAGQGIQEMTVAPAIPDFADELLDAMARDSVPAPRTNPLLSDEHFAGTSGEARKGKGSREAGRGRHPRTSR